MRFLLVFSIAIALHAEDAKPPKSPTVEELTAQVAEQKQENERLTKMLNAYAGKYQHCDQELTVMQTLGVQPTQAGPVKTQRRPLAPSPQPSTSVDEHATPLPPAKPK